MGVAPQTVQRDGQTGSKQHGHHRRCSLDPESALLGAAPFAARGISLPSANNALLLRRVSFICVGGTVFFDRCFLFVQVLGARLRACFGGRTRGIVDEASGMRAAAAEHALTSLAQSTGGKFRPSEERARPPKGTGSNARARKMPLPFFSESAAVCSPNSVKLSLGGVDHEPFVDERAESLHARLVVVTHCHLNVRKRGTS